MYLGKDQEWERLDWRNPAACQEAWGGAQQLFLLHSLTVGSQCQTCTAMQATWFGAAIGRVER